MLPSSIPRGAVAKLQNGAERHRESRLCQAEAGSPPLGGPIGRLSLAIGVKIRIKRPIRGSRPGAERTVSAIPLIGDIDVAAASAPSPPPCPLQSPPRAPFPA